MAYVITDSCIKDSLCVDVCPTDCIHPKSDEAKFEATTQLFVDPEGCIDCGACVPEGVWITVVTNSTPVLTGAVVCETITALSTGCHVEKLMDDIKV